MMRIESLSSKPDRMGRYKLLLSDGTSFLVYRQIVEDYSLYTGKEMEGSEVSKMLTDAGVVSAKMRAIRIISATNVAKKDLEQRLIRKGEDPHQAREAVDWLSGLELVDDRKTAQGIVSRCISQGFGIERAKQALYQKRIPREYWAEALSEYPDQLDAICAYLKSHLEDPNDPKQRKRVMDALIRRGHSYSAIRKGLDRLSIDHDFPEEP